MSLGARATEQIRNQILTWVYRPGEALSETRLGSDLNISRTPVREALRHLQQEGLVRIVPQRGAFVAEIGLRDVVEVFQMREALESTAAALAAQNQGRRDQFVALHAELTVAPKLIGSGRVAEYQALAERLDLAIASACGNRRISQALRVLWGHAHWLRGAALQSQDRLMASVDEHLAIADAIAGADPERGRSAIRRHSTESLQHLLSQMAGLDARPMSSGSHVAGGGLFDASEVRSTRRANSQTRLGTAATRALV